MDIERTLSFNKYVSNLCKKAGTKLSVLARLSSCMTLTQRGLLMKSYIESQFGYCLLVWMFHDRLWNRSINHLLQIVYSDSISSFHESFSIIHHRNIQSLANELYQIKGNLSNKFMSSNFPSRLIKYNFIGW